MAHNTHAANDLRVRRTRKALQQALIDLTAEQGFAATTVAHIADRAMVNRATFYRHYLDKYDLLEQYLGEVYELTASQEEVGPRPGDATDAPPAGLVNMLTHVRSNARFYGAMLGERGDPAFVQRIRHYIEKRFRSLLPSQAAAPKAGALPTELCLSYVSHASIGAIVWWLSEAPDRSPVEVATWISRLSKLDIGLALEDNSR